MIQQPTSPVRRSPRIIEAAPATHTKRWRWFAALPAVIALTTSVACAVMLVSRSGRQELPWYQQLGERSLVDHDYVLASVCYQRLLIDEPNNPQNQFGLAVSLAATGRGHEASQLLARLTPADSAGYLPARFFMAQQLLAAGSPTPRMLEIAEANLKWVVAGQPDNPEVHALLATAYADGGKWELCKMELAKTGLLRPGLEERLLPHPVPGGEVAP